MTARPAARTGPGAIRAQAPLPCLPRDLPSPLRLRLRQFLCCDDLTYPCDVIRREHSPPQRILLALGRS